MKWSVDELLAIMAKGKEAIDADIIKNLDNPQNKDIFDVQNFSLLWGIIGITGIKNASITTQQNIWQAIKASEVLDAHDKGILAGYNQKIASNYEDNRLCAWINLDNYEASAKFNIILWDIIKNNVSLTDEIAPYCLDGVKLVESLARTMLIPQLETYLEQLRGQGAACGMSGTAITAVYEKEAVLRKLCNIIAKARRKLNVEEKKYLYRYMHEAYLDGFEAQNIGMDDAMLARLMIEEDELEGLSELEANDLLQHNWDIAQFSLELEKNDGFYEQTASKLIHVDNSHTTAMVERCLSQISTHAKPKGILFALELVNLNQIKTAVTILIELAKRGRSTEVISFLHRLLPKAKGSELMIMKVLKLNLHNLHLNEVLAGNIGVKEYVTRMYLNAVGVFIEMNLNKEATELLQEMASGGWFAGLPDLVDEFAKCTNIIIKKDKNFAVNLCATAKKMQLKVYNENGEISVRRPDKSSIKIEEVVEVIGEKEKYDVYNKPEFLTQKEENNDNTITLDDNNDSLDEKLIINDKYAEQPQQVEMNHDYTENITDIQNVTESDNQIVEVLDADDEKVLENNNKVQIEEIIKNNANSVLNENVNTDDIQEAPSDLAGMTEINSPQDNSIIANNGNTSLNANTTLSDKNIISEISITEKTSISKIAQELPKIETWNDGDDENEEEKEDERVINIGGIFKITGKDIDKHFSTIKDITAKAVSRTEEIKKKMGNIKEASSKSINKIREMAKKINLSKRK